MKIETYFYSSEYPTADGRTLRIGPGYIEGRLGLRLAHRSPSEDLPTDVLALDYELADREGQLWRTSSVFEAGQLLVYLGDMLGGSQAFRIPPEMSLFDQEPVLAGIRFSTDDRFYRNLLIGEEVIEVQFEYTTITFDLFVDETYSIPRIFARINENSLFVLGDDIGSFAFPIEATNLLRNNTAVYDEDEERWETAILPSPLVFEPVEGEGEPQKGISVIDAR